MDDRTGCTKDLALLISWIMDWYRWSARAGLDENSGKLQASATTPDLRRRLVQAFREAQLDSDRIKHTIEALGCILASRGNAPMHPKQLQRLADARAILRLLRSIPGGKHYRFAAARVLAMAKGAYGWVSRRPNQRDMKPFDAAVWKISGTMKTASPHLRGMFEGAGLLIEPILAEQAVLRLYDMAGLPTASNALRWTDTKGSGTGVVRAWLTKLGWTVEGPWRWKHDRSNAELTLTPGIRCPERRTRVSHLIRDSWRARMWSLFINTVRVDATLLRDQGAEFDIRRFAATRRAAGGDPVRLAVVCGAVRSPAAANQGFGTDPVCPFCGNAIGHLDHCFWECHARPPSVPTPADPIQRRLGWAMAEARSRDSDGDVLSYLSRTAALLWTDRFGDVARTAGGVPWRPGRYRHSA